MKTSLGTITLVAVMSSLVTVGVLELLRSDPQEVKAVLPVGHDGAESNGARGSLALESPVLGEATVSVPPDWEDRQLELERRIAALEQALTQGRAPVGLGTEHLPDNDALREVVLGWVSEERDARGREAQVEGEEDRLKAMEFKARRQALLLAREHELEPWQEEKLVDLFLEIDTREYEIGQSANPLDADPEEFEALWTEFDEWADQRYLEMLGPELLEELFGDE